MPVKILESIFTYDETLDEEYDHHDKFKELIKKIVDYLEQLFHIKFTIKNEILQAIDIYDSYNISYQSQIQQPDGETLTISLSVPIDQFIIRVTNHENQNVLVCYCGLEIPQYDNDNLLEIKYVVQDFVNKMYQFRQGQSLC